MSISELEALHGISYMYYGHESSLFIFCKWFNNSLIMFSEWLKWFSVWLARNINSETLAITVITNFSDLKIQELSQFSLSSNFHFLHTNLKNYYIFLILVLHISRIIHYLVQFFKISSSSRAFSWWTDLEIEVDSRGFNRFFLHKASKEVHRSWSRAAEPVRTRVQRTPFQGDFNLHSLLLLFLGHRLVDRDA